MRVWSNRLQSMFWVLVVVGNAVLWTGCGSDDSNNATPVPTATSAPSPSPTAAAGAGLVGEITDARISDTGQINATFRLTDGSGVPLIATSSSTQDPQQARVRLTIAQLEEYAGGGELGTTFFRYVNNVNATQPAYDSNGTFEMLDAMGRYRYTFKTMLPAGFSRSLTYSIGMQVDRTFEGQQLSANPVFSFVPAGGVPQVWQDVVTEQCNTCHAPLIEHGNRREVALCKLCHTEAGVDEEGVSIDFRDMIHKIHAGKELPSVVEGPPGTTYEIDGSVFAEKLADGSVIGVGFPRALEECAPCHANAPTGDYHRTKASAPACATCHDDVNPSTMTTQAGPPGTNHSPGAYLDGQCSECHRAEMNMEFDITVPGAHVVPERSTQLAGLNVSITNVSNHDAGQRPTFSFLITDNDGTPLRDLSGLGVLAFNYSGPTTDYTTVLNGLPLGSMPSGTLVGPDAQGVFQFTPNAAIPASATGTWAVGVEARRAVQLTSSITVNEAAVNPVVTFAVDDSMPEPHRTIVDGERCGVCHGEFSKDFSVHGNLRNQIEYCEICHNATQSDAARRRRDPAAVAAGELTEPIDFKVMIHKIHRGQDLVQEPYVVYGFGPAPLGYTKHDFGELRFSGDLRDCAACHVEDSQLLPPYPSTAMPTSRTMLDPQTGDPVPADPDHIAPITAVCTSCHDSDAASAHAETNTATDGIEACLVCHQEGRDFAVSTLHAGRN